MKSTYSRFLTTGAVCALVTPSLAQTLFTDPFDTDTSANWSVNLQGSGTSDATFAFDYSSVGIPSSPDSGGSTLGLRLRANQFGGTGAFPSGVSVSPTGQNLTGDYRVEFEMWLNYNGPLGPGGSGSTQVTGMGIGTGGTTAQIAGGTIDSVSFGATVDGNSSVDYRAYVPAVQTGYLATSGVFAAGTGTAPDARNNSHPYYAGFGGASAPAAQTALFAQQTGTTVVGSLGFAWRDVVIEKVGTEVQWSIDGTLIATVDLTTAGDLGGGSILFSHYDSNATVSTDANSPQLLFGLIDNVRVVAVPEPATVALGLAGIGLLLGRRRRA